MNTPLSLLLLGFTFSAAAKAEIVDLYFEHTTPASATFVGGAGNSDSVSIGSTLAAPAPFTVAYADRASFIGLTGSYQADFSIGEVLGFGSAQSATLTTINGLFSLGDGQGGWLSGQISGGQLFRTARTLALKFDVTDLGFSGSSAWLETLVPSGGLSVELPLYFDSANPTLFALKQTGSNTQGWVYDGYLASCAAPIPESPWAAAALGLFAAGVAIRRKALGSLAA